MKLDQWFASFSEPSEVILAWASLYGSLIHAYVYILESVHYLAIHYGCVQWPARLFAIAERTSAFLLSNNVTMYRIIDFTHTLLFWLSWIDLF